MKKHKVKLYELYCSACIDDPNIECPRDADVKCLICNRIFCGGHITMHLKEEHCVTADLTYCSKSKKK